VNLGSEGNAWANAATGAGGFSNTIETAGSAQVSVFGNVNGATTITVQVSQDGQTWYDTTLTAVAAGAGNFYIAGSIGARYVRLKSSNAVTATATIAAKR
jgi:streptogramin lyase